MPNSLCNTHLDGHHLRWDPEFFDTPNPKIFDRQHWRDAGLDTGSARGRGETLFFQHRDTEFALRHYYRGGMAAKISRDTFLYRGLENSRAFGEFNLLHALYSDGLPVPRPAACHTEIHGGVFARGDIITTRILGSKSIVSMLTHSSLPAETWTAIGAMVKQFHRAGLDHHDLNANNILVDENSKLWLIDFDRGKRKKPADTWQKRNLARLLRSLRKEKSRAAQWHGTPQDWLNLLEGYHAS